MNILLIGSSSAIAVAIARAYARDNHALFLVSRDPARLTIQKNDLEVRGADRVETFCTDLTDTCRHPALVDAAVASLGTIDLVLVCHGVLPDQRACEQDYAAVHASVEVNVLSVLSLLTSLGNFFELQGSGTLGVITSVAGDRGRPSNYVYGASKAMLSTYLEGLRARLHRRSVVVVDIRPGLVDSPMTRDIPKGPLFSSTTRVATCILHGIAREKRVIYAPGYWRFIMGVVKLIPDVIFKRLSL